MGKDPGSPRGIAGWVRRRLPAMLRGYGISEAYLFGSWGRGDADESSDIDLIIVAPSQRPFVDRFRDYPGVWQGAPTGIDLLIYTPEEFATQRRVNRFVRHVLREARRIV
jgi:predicted nucleotidyltransferase